MVRAGLEPRRSVYEWEAALRELGDGHRYDELWLLVRQAPLIWAARALQRLAGQGWLPLAAAERRVCERLIDRAVACRKPPSAKLVLGRPVVLADDADWVQCLVVSPRGDLLAIGDRGEWAARLWHIPSGEPAGTLTSAVWGYDRLAISPDNALVAGCSLGVSLWRLGSSGRAEALATGRRGTDTVAMTPDGLFLVGASRDGSVRLWDLPAGTPRAKLRGHPKGRPCLAITPDGRLLATASYRPYAHRLFNDIEGFSRRKPVRLWHLPSGEPAGRLQARGIRSLMVTPDGGLLIGVGAAGTSWVWRLPSGTLVSTMNWVQGDDRDVVMSPDGRVLVGMVAGDEKIHVRPLPSGEPTITLEHPYGQRLSYRFERLAVSPDGNLLFVAGSLAGPVYAWHLPSGQYLGPLPGSTEGLKPEYTMEQDHFGHMELTRTSFSTYAGAKVLTTTPDGSVIAATNGSPGYVRMWHPEPVLAGYLIPGQVTSNDVTRLRGRLPTDLPAEDRAWIELLTALVRYQRSSPQDHAAARRAGSG